jgi:hypothetical protein
VTDNDMPAPPFPQRDSAALKVVVQSTLDSLSKREMTPEQAVVYAAVHGWYEGHIEGEDRCPGCDFRGEAPKGIDRDRWIADHSNSR